MVVDSGASDHLLDEELLLSLQDSMRGFKNVEEPETIVTAGKEKVFAAATETI